MLLIFIHLLEIVGGTIYFKGDVACFRGCRAYLSIYYEPPGMIISIDIIMLFVSASFAIYSLFKILQVATGDGIAMAHRAQAVISNME